MAETALGNIQKAAPPPLSQPLDSSDVAWVAVPVPQPPEVLARLLHDVEAIFRVNPFLTFSVWRELAPGHYHAEFHNESNNQNVAVDFEVMPGPGQGLTLRYASGLKKRTIFAVEPGEGGRGGSRLVIVDDYEGLPEAERAARLAEVDKSLLAWGRALRKYFLRLARWSWVPGWRWYLRRVWIPMRPMARRIVWLIWIVTLLEFAFFLFLILILVIEQGR
jgi:hypothetical protein